jgi:hypothetical protein
LGQDNTQERFFFGHSAAAPKGRIDVVLDIDRDIEADNVIAIQMDDLDAEIWGRRFDIVMVNKVTTSKRKRAFRVQYYEVEGVEPGKHQLYTDEFFKSEKAALEGNWKLTKNKNTISPKAALCLSWIEDGKIHPEYKHILQEALMVDESI